MAQRIVMIEDDARLAAMVRDYLGDAGFVVTVEPTAARGIAAVRRDPPDAVILDVMLPDLDGFGVLRELRPDFQSPILMLTARGDATDRVVGLELGADDYVPKPFEPRELLARLRAILRRAQGAPAVATAGRTPPLRFGRLEIDRAARVVRVDGEERTVTSYQFALLVAFAENAGRVLSRDQIMDLVKGEPIEAFDRSIDVHVSRIRAAIEDDPRHPRRIITVRGAGYVFARSQDGDER